MIYDDTIYNLFSTLYYQSLSTEEKKTLLLKKNKIKIKEKKRVSFN